MDDDGLLSELVQVRYGGQEGRGGGRDCHELTTAQGRKRGDEWVGIVSKYLNLERC